MYRGFSASTNIFFPEELKQKEAQISIKLNEEIEIDLNDESYVFIKLYAMHGRKNTKKPIFNEFAFE